MDRGERGIALWGLILGIPSLVAAILTLTSYLPLLSVAIGLGIFLLIVFLLWVWSSIRVIQIREESQPHSSTPESKEWLELEKITLDYLADVKSFGPYSLRANDELQVEIVSAGPVAVTLSGPSIDGREETLQECHPSTSLRRAWPVIRDGDYHVVLAPGRPPTHRGPAPRAVSLTVRFKKATVGYHITRS